MRQGMQYRAKKSATTGLDVADKIFSNSDSELMSKTDMESVAQELVFLFSKKGFTALSFFEQHNLSDAIFITLYIAWVMPKHFSSKTAKNKVFFAI